MILGLGGRFCSGKTSVANKICDLLPQADHTSFAKVLKLVYNELGTKCYGLNLDPNEKDRSGLQTLGVTMRDLIDEDIWVNAVFKKGVLARYMDSDDILILSDVRFENELAGIHKYNGVTVFIERDTDTRLRTYEALYQTLPSIDQQTHVSETLDPKGFMYTVYNDGPDINKVTNDVLNIIDFELARRFTPQ